VSEAPPADGPGKKKPLKYAAIIGSLVIVALILSPVSPLALSTYNPSSTSAGTIAEPPQPENTSEQDVLACTSLIQGVEYVIVGGRIQPIPDEVLPEETDEFEEPAEPVLNLTSEEKLASDTLLGEFCNRPELVGQLSKAYDPTVNLVAYGCEVSSGKAGDVAMQDSIEDYREIYCTSAVETIEFELASWAESMDSFTTDIIPAARERVGNDRASGALLDEAQVIIANATATLVDAQERLDSGLIYDAATTLDKAIADFTVLIDREDMVTLLDL
jgi:hypothetical protein